MFGIRTKINGESNGVFSLPVCGIITRLPRKSARPMFSAGADKERHIAALKKAGGKITVDAEAVCT